jgi:hypothetical protein
MCVDDSYVFCAQEKGLKFCYIIVFFGRFFNCLCLFGKAVFGDNFGHEGEILFFDGGLSGAGSFEATIFVSLSADWRGSQDGFCAA